MRNPRARFAVLCALAVVPAPGPLSAAEQMAPPAAVAYQPPAGNPAPRRVGGNSRGLPPALPAVAVLAPDHLGLTVSEQPRLLWYLAAPTTARIELTLVDPARAAPLIETVAAGDRAGIHEFQPGAHGVKLEPGVQYEWSIAIVTDPAQRSRDVFAAGAIMRVEPSAALAQTLHLAAADGRAAAYANAGVWYDALDAMSAEIAARPGDRAPRERRAAVLEQAGLAEAAAFERRE